jgi:hypothetical protein
MTTHLKSTIPHRYIHKPDEYLRSMEILTINQMIFPYINQMNSMNTYLVFIPSKKEAIHLVPPGRSHCFVDDSSREIHEITMK